MPRSAGAGKRDGRNQCWVKGLWNLDTVSSPPQSEQNTQGRNDCLTGHTSSIQRALLWYEFSPSQGMHSASSKRLRVCCQDDNTGQISPLSLLLSFHPFPSLSCLPPPTPPVLLILFPQSRLLSISPNERLVRRNGERGEGKGIYSKIAIWGRKWNRETTERIVINYVPGRV